MRICLLICLVRWIYLYCKKSEIHMRVKVQENRNFFFYFSTEYLVKLIHFSDQHHGQLLVVQTTYPASALCFRN